MAANVSGEYRIFNYYEGLCSSGDFPKEIAKVLSLGVRSEAIKDADDNILQAPVVLPKKNWDIVFPVPDAEYQYDSDDITVEEFTAKIMNQVNKIADTVILKTTTTSKEISFENYDDLTIDNDSNKADLTMYLEIYRPTYLADPEQYPLDCERQGIIPRCITREMYSDSYNTTASTQEEIWSDTRISSEYDVESVTTGTVDFNADNCDRIIQKFSRIVDGVSMNMPTVSNPITSMEISSAYLAKIKQNDAELYELILSNLNSNEGIEPKDYNRLSTVTIECTYIDGTTYTLMINGKRNDTYYRINTGAQFKVAYPSINKIIPELYLDGIYKPLDPTEYHSNGQTVVFDFDDGDGGRDFNIFEDGKLVIRYTYETTTNDIITDRTSILNHHYVLMRMFDHINTEKSGPAENVYNASGELIQTNSHISPWSKLSWYRDFEEVMLDTLDSDIAINNINDGTVYVPIETPGLTSDTKIRYWINANNDRFSLIVMGNPSLDYQKDRHLISVCYCGRIDSFENSINDTAGNFALFTSSSTEPCNTTLESVQNVIQNRPKFNLDSVTLASDEYDHNALEAYLADDYLFWNSYISGVSEYYVQLPSKMYFERKTWPKYMIVRKNANGTHTPLTPLQPVFKKTFIMSNGKSNVMQFSIDPKNANNANITGDCYVVVYCNIYTETFVITSGITRDVFGNVVSVNKINEYGANTSDGVTSISMFHTRSKAYYQKHHMLFATTEEYMSKVMYGKSSYTGEYYADRIKVTHGNDGPRGTLSDLLVIDSSSLYAMDELVINKNFEKEREQYEETFVYFPVTAPYSPLSDSPNARYGVAIKKEEREPLYEDELKNVTIGINELTTLASNWVPVSNNFYPTVKTRSGCDVYWTVVNNSSWYINENNKVDFVPLQIAMSNTEQYNGNMEVPAMTSAAGITISAATDAQKVTDVSKNTSYIKLTGGLLPVQDSAYHNLEPGENETVYPYTYFYGISDTPIDSIRVDAYLHVLIDDQCIDNHEIFNYHLENIPYDGSTIDMNNDNNGFTTDDIEINSAAPDKYLIIYCAYRTKEQGSNNWQEYKIANFTCLPLKKDGESPNALLRYPCKINIMTEVGRGRYFTQNIPTNTLINDTNEYDKNYEFTVVPEEGYEIDKYQAYKMGVANTDDNKLAYEVTRVDNDNGSAKLTFKNITQDTEIKVKFKLSANN